MLRTNQAKAKITYSREFLSSISHILNQLVALVPKVTDYETINRLQDNLLEIQRRAGCRSGRITTVGRLLFSAISSPLGPDIGLFRNATAQLAAFLAEEDPNYCYSTELLGLVKREADALSSITGEAEKLIRSICQKNSSLDAKDEYGFTALAYATKNGHAETVRLLLEAKATSLPVDPVQSPLAKMTLHGAIANNKLTAVVSLLEKQADPNALNAQQATPLMSAAHLGNKFVTQLLVDRNADIHYKNTHGDTALHIAAAHGKAEVVTFLLDEKAQVDQLNKNNCSPLMTAAYHGHHSIIQILLNAKANIDRVSSAKETALNIATRYGHGEIVRLLEDRKASIERNARVDATDTNLAGLSMFQQRVDNSQENQTLQPETPSITEPPLTNAPQ